jgi:hypothetical protein
LRFLLSHHIQQNVVQESFGSGFYINTNIRI